MVEEKLVENTETQATETQDEETLDSSTDETQDEEATSEKATEEVPFNEHPRFKELISEKNELKDEVKQLRNQVFDAVKPKEDKTDQDAGKSLEEKAFYQDMDKRMRKVAAEERSKAEVEIQAVRNEYGKLAANQFLNSHPDVKKGSEELKDVVRKAQEIGGNLEDAYKIVMFDSNAQREVEKVKQKKVLKTKEKVAANVETKSLPEGAIKARDDKSFEDTFNAAYDKTEADMQS